MKTLNEILNILREHREIFKEKFGVREIGIFGSYAKGEQKQGSDLDIIVEFENEDSLGGFEYIGLLMDVEEYIHKEKGFYRD